MNPSRSRIRSAAEWMAVAAGLGASAYAAYVGVAWSRYGRVSSPSPDEVDPLLDRFMPAYEVVDRHRIRIAAPAPVTLAAGRDLDLFRQPLVRAIFKGRELLLGAAPDDRARPLGLLAAVQSLGWVVLDEIPDREIIVGGATRPWEPNPTFRSIPAEQFATFQDPATSRSCGPCVLTPSAHIPRSFVRKRARSRLMPPRAHCSADIGRVCRRASSSFAGRPSRP
jgi:hypothetical protein